MIGAETLRDCARWTETENEDWFAPECRQAPSAADILRAYNVIRAYGFDSIDSALDPEDGAPPDARIAIRAYLNAS